MHFILVGSRCKIRALEHSNTPRQSIYSGDDEVSPIITSIQYFEEQVDQFLNWDEHLLTITKKIFRGIEVLRFAK